MVLSSAALCAAIPSGQPAAGAVLGAGTVHVCILGQILGVNSSKFGVDCCWKSDFLLVAACWGLAVLDRLWAAEGCELSAYGRAMVVAPFRTGWWWLEGLTWSFATPGAHRPRPRLPLPGPVLPRAGSHPSCLDVGISW